MNLFQENVTDYLNDSIFPILLSAMEEMLLEADRQNVVKVYNVIILQYFSNNYKIILSSKYSFYIQKKIIFCKRKHVSYRCTSVRLMVWIISQRSYGIEIHDIRKDRMSG
jgi:hypothetical protein